MHRLRHRAHHQLPAKKILIRDLIGLRLIRPLVIQRPHQGFSQPMSPLHGGIQIWNQPVPEAQPGCHDALRFRPIGPWFLAQEI